MVNSERRLFRRREMSEIPTQLQSPTKPVARMFLGSAFPSLYHFERDQIYVSTRQLRHSMEHLPQVDYRTGAKLLAHDQLHNYEQGAFDEWARGVDGWIVRDGGKPTVKEALDSIFLDFEERQDVAGLEAYTAKGLYYGYLSADDRVWRDEKSLAKQIESNRKILVKNLVEGSRVGLRRSIDLKLLQGRIRALGEVIPSGQKDVLFLAMADGLRQSIQELSLSGRERKRVLEGIIHIGMQEPDRASDREMFARLAHVADDEQNESGIPRRPLLTTAIVGSLAVAGGLGGLWYQESRRHPEDTFLHPFTGEANEVAEKELGGITAGDFWEPSEKVMFALGRERAFIHDQKVLPIFPPAVMAQRKALEWAAKDTDNIPVNVLATVATITSAGKIDAHVKDAWGLTGVVPGYHLNKVVQVAHELGVDGSDPAKALTNPFVASKVAALILHENYQAALGHGHSPVDAWVQAIGEYTSRQRRFTEASLQAQLDRMHAKRFFITAEIAALLRKQEVSDGEISRELISKGVDERVFAYRQVVRNRNRVYAPLFSHRATIHTILWPALARQKITVSAHAGVTDAAARELTADLNNACTDYQTNVSDYLPFPLPPALQLWFADGNESLFLNAPSNNNNLNAYPRGTYFDSPPVIG